MMTERDMEKMLCYLADKVDKLEKERCKCNDGNDAKTLEDLAKKPKPQHPESLYNQKFVTNYDEDEECTTCSA
jgi:hypothetical protein